MIGLAIINPTKFKDKDSPRFLRVFIDLCLVLVVLH